jgi:Regulator of chromosome condensation (RCC1) repeat
MTRATPTRLAWIIVASMPVLLVGLSCSSGEVEDIETPHGNDAGSARTPSQDGGAPDVVVPDVTPPDAGTPEPLKVVCQTEPCYVAVSGNAGRHVCGLVDDGTVRCWGRDTEQTAPNDGALGRGGPVSIVEGAKPAPVVGLSGVTQVSVGQNLGTCARKSDGSVACWGKNDFGQLGGPPSEARLALPTRVEDLPPVDEVRLGARTGCAISAGDRALYCWGKTMRGLGVDDGGAATFPPRLVTTLRPPVKAVAIGTWNDQDTIVALLDGDVLATIGAFPAGESSVETPLERPQEISGVVRSGPFVYLTSDGLLHRWRGTFLPLNRTTVGDTVHLPSSSQIVEMKGSAAGQLEQGGALLATGRLFRWGSNAAGALGVPPELLPVAKYPLEMTMVGSRVVSFATTFGSTCVSLVNGTIECWGTNVYGELGRGIVDQAAHPEARVIE